MSDPKYPEAEKWAKVADIAAEIRAFLDWQAYTYEPDAFTMPSLQTQLERYFDIDPNKLEAERQAMLDVIRGSNA